MSGTQRAELSLAQDDDVDLDTIALSSTYAVMRSRTVAITVGRTSHYDKVMILEQILPGESEQEFRDRLTLLMNREATAEVDAMGEWMKEMGL